MSTGTLVYRSILWAWLRWAWSCNESVLCILIKSGSEPEKLRVRFWLIIKKASRWGLLKGTLCLSHLTLLLVTFPHWRVSALPSVSSVKVLYKLTDAHVKRPASKKWSQDCESTKCRVCENQVYPQSLDSRQKCSTYYKGEDAVPNATWLRVLLEDWAGETPFSMCTEGIVGFEAEILRCSWGWYNESFLTLLLWDQEINWKVSKEASDRAAKYPSDASITLNW